MTKYILIEDGIDTQLKVVVLQDDDNEEVVVLAKDEETYYRLTQVPTKIDMGYTFDSSIAWAIHDDESKLTWNPTLFNDDEDYIAIDSFGFFAQMVDSNDELSCISRHHNVEILYDEGYTLPSIHSWVATGLPQALKIDPVRIIAKRTERAPDLFSEGYSLASVVRWIGCGENGVLTKTTHPTETFQDRYTHYELLASLNYEYESIMDCLRTGDTTSLITIPNVHDIF